jgi:hypothetical protein
MGKDKESAKSPTLPLPPPRVTVDEFTEAVFSGVMRAIQTQQRAGAIQKPGHIIYGIIWDPNGGPFQVEQAPAAKATGE